MEEDFSKKLYVQNVEDWQNDLSKKRFSDRKLEVKVIERGIVLPARKMKGEWKGGICDSEFNFIAGFSRKKNNTRGVRCRPFIILCRQK